MARNWDEIMKVCDWLAYTGNVGIIAAILPSIPDEELTNSYLERRMEFLNVFNRFDKVQFYHVENNILNIHACLTTFDKIVRFICFFCELAVTILQREFSGKIQSETKWENLRRRVVFQVWIVFVLSLPFFFHYLSRWVLQLWH
jgi:hypothetical protein